MVRPPCCDKQNVKRGLWSAEEDAKILAYVSKHGTGNWAAAPRKAGLFAGLRRCGKSCRLRWTNYLRPDLKHDDFTPQEEELIVRLHAAIGSRWSIIAQQLPGRTDNDVKNYWNTKLRKKLSEMGIDPVTHKPFSQILADYGSIGGLLKSGNRIGSLSRDLKNAFIAKPEQYSSRPEGVSNINSNLMTTGVPPKEEPVQECFLTSNFNNDTDYNQPMDLLDQLQAIKLLTEASSCGKCETNSAHFHNEGPLSSTTSSTSSTCSTAAQDKTSADFSWRDFLLEDVFLPVDPTEEQNLEFPSKDFTDHKHHVEPKCQNVMIPQGQVNCEVLTTIHAGNEGDLPITTSHGYDQIPSCSSSSFVASILDQENEILLDFPGLLEEPFYY